MTIRNRSFTIGPWGAQNQQKEQNNGADRLPTRGSKIKYDRVSDGKTEDLIPSFQNASHVLQNEQNGDNRPKSNPGALKECVSKQKTRLVNPSDEKITFSSNGSELTMSRIEGECPRRDAQKRTYLRPSGC